MEIINRNKLLLLLIGLLLAAAVAIGITANPLIRYFTSDWKEKSNRQIKQIEFESAEFITNYQNNLLNQMMEFTSAFDELISSPDYQERSLFQLVNNDKFSKYHIQVFNNDTDLVAWGSKYGNTLNYESSGIYNNRECYFHKSDLYVFLTSYTFSENYKIYISLPVEKEYGLSNQYYEPVSLAHDLTGKFETSTEINYSSVRVNDNKDGRKFSFPLHNNYNNTIAFLTINKPSISIFRNSILEKLVIIQSYLVLLAFLLLGMLFYKNKELLKYRSLKFILIAIYVLIFRVLLFLFDIPSKLMSTQLNDPAYFSSSFAFGIVRSPLEFFLTGVSVLFVVIVGVRYIIHYMNEENYPRHSNWVYIISSGFLSVVFVLSLRGFGATIRSIVFESSLRYFKYPSLLPDLPTIVMDFNLLVLGFCSILLLILLSVFILIFLKQIIRKHINLAALFVFVVLQLTALIFDLAQNQPQGTPGLRIITILAVFIFAYFFVKNKNMTALYIISILFLSSLVTISYLTYYNADYEKKSLRTTAYELIKTDEDFINTLIRSTLEDTQIITDMKEILSDSNGRNYSASAFKVWSNSRLENETISSLVNIIDSNKILLGSYGYQFYEDFIWDWSLPDTSRNIKVSITPIENTDNKIIRGIRPVYKNESLFGYLEISVLHDLHSLGFEDSPNFISSSKAFKESPVNVKQLKIFDFQNGELVNYYTDLIPSDSETETILNTDLNEYNEAWITMPLNDIEHIVYVKKVADKNKNRLLAAALAEKDLTWSIFDFFKIFFIHTIFILIGLILAYLVYFRRFYQLRYSFRTQLLVAFILISTIPLLLLAIYFKNLTDEKNTSAIYYKLGKRADRVETYLDDYTDEDSLIPDFLLARASLDLGINYDLFLGPDLIFSSKDVYYEIGLMPGILNSEVYSNLVLTGLTEFVVSESIENYEYHSFYHKASLAGQDYLIKVSDVFNQIQLPMSSTEVDIFLFGSYSLAIILVIAFSTFLANQISSPIRRLTSATRSVADGDLSVSVEERNKGEIQELVDGFNDMVKELEKNQRQLAEVEREAAWRDMAKQVAHEIKNPLTPMKLAVQQLMAARLDKSDKFDDIFDKVTGTVIKQIDILKNIATEFSNYAKMPDLKLHEINLVDSIKQVANLFTEDKVIITCDFERNDYLVNADSEQLERTLVNLIKNSIQAGANEIKFDLRQSESELMLRVSDNGKGIPQSIKDRIFDADFTTKIEGMGLGLHMAKRFFGLIDSDIEVESTSTAGTTIIITFPLNNS